MADSRPALRKLAAALEGLPEVTEATSYGYPSFKVGKKFLCRIKDADTAVLMCPLEEKEMLMAAAPGIYFETDHYKGWPAILVRINAMDAAELRYRLRRAWLMQARESACKDSVARGALIRKCLPAAVRAGCGRPESSSRIGSRRHAR